ncbi:hypothetical protein YPPY66_1387 [Yersinia pestis PY-66]|uniref:Uncharacterized protein n=2 Tax=Yersinia pestis TaxID=632 RepID=A0AAV3BCC0_YERPE|nr:hypothetical protein [Yersinia pestis]EDR31387.1 conserved hypothetical protein [Yersinia pestis biovar Orientalis str. IP275]EDR50633.1 conserved hypothetical protein [Yersinia pestis biovar Antiqua str. B42003004]EDR58419.1 conserved hypothetical protein [Yersinia pestis biovar Orientalis str. MG05-1020]EDR65663.1 conserved hypothetical protein [Yersinia pestis biovar Mediaevalis str. K1973002]EFA46902.1 conserved hypothetical protein [Yersinia pestis KIM D27]EIQ91845.1 hypothetical prot
MNNGKSADKSVNEEQYLANNPFISVAFQATGMLAALTHPYHLVI